MSVSMQLIFFGAIVMSVFFLGVPFSLMSLAEKDKKVFVPLSVLTGTGIITFLAYYFSIIGLGMKNFALPVLIVLVVCAIGVCIVYRKKLLYFIKLELSDLIKLCICMIAGIIVLTPVVLYNGGFTYTDTYTYVSIADVLQDFGYNKMIENDMYKPYLTQINLYQDLGYRIGAQMLLAFFTAVFSEIFSLALYSPIAALGVVLCGCGAWIFVELNYHENKFSSLMSVLLVALNVPVVLWSAIYGFLPQTYGLAFFMVAFGMLIALVRNNLVNKMHYVYCAMFIALIGLTYNELIPFWVLTAAFFAVMHIIINRKTKPTFGILLRKLVILAILTILMLGPYFVKMIKAILAQLKVSTVGWEHQGGFWTFVGYIFGTVPADFYYDSPQYDKVTKIGYFVFTMFLLLVLLYSIIKLCKIKRQMVMDLLVAFLPFVIMLIYFIFFADNPFGEGKGNKWSIYKVVQYAIVIILPYSGALISTLFTGKKKILISLVGVLLLSVSIRNGIVYANESVEPIRQLTGNRENPIGEYYKLYEVYKDEERTINLIGAPDTHRKLVTYFLQDNRLMSNWGSDAYFYVYHDFVPQYDANGITLYFNPYEENIIANFKEMSNLPVAVEVGGTFYPKETSETDEWNWCSDNKGVIKLFNYSTNKKIRLAFEISSVADDATDVLISNEMGEILQTVSTNNQTKERVELILEFGNEDGLELNLSYKGNGMQTEMGRNITFSIWNMKVEEVW